MKSCVPKDTGKYILRGQPFGSKQRAMLKSGNNTALFYGIQKNALKRALVAESTGLRGGAALSHGLPETRCGRLGAPLLVWQSVPLQTFFAGAAAKNA